MAWNFGALVVFLILPYDLKMVGANACAIGMLVHLAGRRTAMARAQYFVVLHEGQWKISHSDKHYGPYKIQADAIKAAVDAAHKSGQQGHDAQVLIQGENNQFRTEWTYGHDPYPPPG